MTKPKVKAKTLVTVEDVKEAAVTEKAEVSIVSLTADLMTAQKEIASLTKDLSEAQKEITSLNLKMLQTKAFLSDILKPCPVCGERTLMLDWNTKVFVLMCGKQGCQKYRVPIRNVRKAEIAWCGDILGDYHEKEVKDA